MVGVIVRLDSDTMWLLSFGLLIAPLAFLALIAFSGVKTFVAWKRGDRASGAGYLAIVAMIPLFAIFGWWSADVFDVLHKGAEIRSAIEAMRKGEAIKDQAIEVISIDPLVAAYRIYIPIPLAPGLTQLIVIDETGRFLELSRQGRARELAATPQLANRAYRSYCRLHISQWMGTYYVAKQYDVEDCH